MLNILIKTLGLPFYKQHAGLFVVFIYLLFGMIKGYDLIYFHIALLVSICSSMLNLALLFLFWIMYSLKCLHFVKQKLSQDDYRFTKSLSTLSKLTQFKTWLKLYAFLLLPVLIYSIVVIGAAIKNQYYFSAVATIVALFVIFGSLIFYTFNFTNYAFVVKKEWLIFSNIKLNKPFWTWPIFYLLKEQPVVFLLCKTVSLLFFKAILLVFADVGDDIRVYLTATLAVVLSHSVLVLNLIKFDANYLSFAKHLPLKAITRLINWTLIFSVLLLPELILLVILTPYSLINLLNCFVFAISGILFLKLLVYHLKANTERYMKYLLIFFFVAMLAVLANYYLIFSLLMIAVSVSTFLIQYDKTDIKELAE